jgi:hypothetical protein
LQVQRDVVPMLLEPVCRHAHPHVLLSASIAWRRGPASVVHWYMYGSTEVLQHKEVAARVPPHVV